jgi:hypothetical protein
MVKMAIKSSFLCESDNDLAEFKVKLREKEAGEWEDRIDYLSTYRLKCLRTQQSLYGNVEILEVEPLPRIVSKWVPKDE